MRNPPDAYKNLITPRRNKRVGDTYMLSLVVSTNSI